LIFFGNCATRVKVDQKQELSLILLSLEKKNSRVFSLTCLL